MAKIARLIGGPGTGKTTELLRIMGKVIDTGVDPYDIGFISFTRAARAEAAERVQKEFNVNASSLQRNGWFRTVHSVCHHQLGRSKTGGLLTGTKDDNEWLVKSLGMPCKMASASGDKDNLTADLDTGTEDDRASRALQIWSVARNRLCDPAEVWQEEKLQGADVPEQRVCIDVIKKYEQAKYRDGRCDFTDLLGMFAGWQWRPEGEPAWREPAYELPECRAWFCDEHQDASRLVHSAVMRLLDSPACLYAYFSGDPFQALYRFAGGDHHCMLEGLSDVLDRSRTMPQSWRCPRKVMQLAERVLSGCSDYFDREIRPMESDGEVHRVRSIEDVIEAGRMDQEWIMQARTNFLASKIGKALTKRGVPWVSESGGASYIKPTSIKMCLAFQSLASGRSVERAVWKSIIKKIPSGSGDTACLGRGWKTRVIAGDAGIPEQVSVDNIGQYGATPRLEGMIRSGEWRSLVEGSQLFLEASRRFGEEIAVSPKIRVGTIHSFKGSGAPNVMMLTGLTTRVGQAMATEEGRDAERRVAYVGVSRCSDRLFLLSQPGDRFHFELD